MKKMRLKVYNQGRHMGDIEVVPEEIETPPKTAIWRIFALVFYIGVFLFCMKILISLIF